MPPRINQQPRRSMSDRSVYAHRMNLNREQFLMAVERGKALLGELSAGYPELKLYPVFCRFGPRSGQCGLTTDLKKIVMEFPEMLAGESFGREKAGQKTQNVDATSPSRSSREENCHEKHKNSQGELAKSLRAESFSRDGIQPLRKLLSEIRAAEKGGEKETVSRLWKQVNEVERELLDPELKLYCGDVLIEFRPGVLKYESLRRLQWDSRLPPDLNEVGNVRVVAGSLEFLAGRKK